MFEICLKNYSIVSNKLLLPAVLFLFITTLAGAPGQAQAQPKLRLAVPFTDHMVLQRDKTTKVWGTASPDAQIEISIGKQLKIGKASSKGKFKLELEPLGAGGPYTLTVKAKSKDGSGESQTVRDVMVGEVWLCAGQSNMSMPVKDLPIKEQEQIKSDLSNKLRVLQMPITLKTKATTKTCAAWSGAMDLDVSNYSALALAYGKKLQEKLGCPVGILVAAVPGSPIDTWLPASSLKSIEPYCSVLSTRGDNIAPADLSYRNGAACAMAYNGMIRPLIPYTIQGVLWYQGEANLGRAKEYGTLFPLLIDKWRSAWNQEPPEYPFVFVQMPNCRYFSNTLGEGVWAELRDAQSRATSLQNVTQVTAIDLGDADDIHPKRKTALAERIAAQVKGKIYGAQEKCCGPNPIRFERNGNAVFVTFENAVSGLTLVGNGCFQIAGMNGKLVTAQCEAKGNKVRVWNDLVKNPVEIRYCWTDSPDGYLINQAQVPAAPFLKSLF